MATSVTENTRSSRNTEAQGRRGPFILEDIERIELLFVFSLEPNK